MDANQQRFWLWSQDSDWLAREHCSFDADERVLTLADERPAPAVIDGITRASRAETELAMLPLLRDRLGTYGRWDAATNTLRGFGAFNGDVVRYATSAPGSPVSMALDASDAVVFGFSDRIEMLDLRDRYAPLRLDLPVFDGLVRYKPHAIACDARGGRVALDRVQRCLMRIAGTPWPDRAGVDYDARTFRPDPENPNAPHLEVLIATLDTTTRPVTVAMSAQGRIAIAAWGTDGALQLTVLDGLHGQQLALQPTVVTLAGAEYAHALAWMNEQQVALRVSDLSEALVYDLGATVAGTVAGAADTAILPLGRRYPTEDAAPGPFVSAQFWPPHVAMADAVEALVAPATRELVPLSWRAYANQGQARGRKIDTGALDLLWHRLYLEADIPAGCGVLIELAANDDNTVPAATDWHPHWAGDAHALDALPSLPSEMPKAAWLRQASELPHRAGMLTCPSVPGRTGLFCVLVQRAGRRLRDLRGRFLFLRITLVGNGRASPEVAAVRAWGDRFSYVRNYLPELYRDDDEFDRGATGAATPHDFLARYVELFEGELTPLEDRIADVRVLTDPHSVPDAWLPWLSGWTGERFPARLPPDLHRTWLKNAPALRRLRGTLEGLQLGLDIATQGAVTLGRILLVEDFRLRRTMATLLGIDLDRADDPLLPGLVVSGNSFVGDTLILGDADDTQARQEFLALFGSDIESAAEAATVASVYERTAHRATVLVHEGLDTDLIELVANIAQELAPAHVLVKVMAAREPFLVGVASLVGIDSFLRAPMPLQPARVDISAIGRGDRIMGGGSLDWRLEDGVSGPVGDGLPRAKLAGPEVVAPTASFVLDGRGSVSGPDASLVAWRFTQTGLPKK
jgi:phage tail-like protein